MIRTNRLPSLARNHKPYIVCSNPVIHFSLKTRYSKASRLGLVVYGYRNYLLSLLFLGHVEVAELVRILSVSDNSKEITKLLLLQVLLGQVLQVALGHGDVGVDNNSSLLLGDLDGFTEVSGLVSDLDSITEVLLLRKNK